MEYTLDIPPSLTAKFAELGYPSPLDGLHAATKLLVGLGPEGWTTITASADAAGTTPAKHILSILNKQAEPSPATATPSPKRRQSNTERDTKIAADYFAKAGTYPVLAAKYGLSVVRIVQIVAKARAEQAVKLNPQSV